jgi:hypothetical protein
MSYIRIDRLNEDHDGQLPVELLNMTVGQMLDKIGELDTKGDAEYEIIEDALKAISDKVLGNGYAADEINFTPDDSIEADDESTEIEDEDMPTYDDLDARSNDASANSENDALGAFEF